MAGGRAKPPVPVQALGRRFIRPLHRPPTFAKHVYALLESVGFGLPG